MDISRNEITEYAKVLGFDDTRFGSADGAIHDIHGGQTSPRDLLPGAKCILVLFKQYHPASATPPDHMAMSSYYVASHAAYTAAKELTAYLTGRGAKAVHTISILARDAALRTGGFLGDSGFYFHPQYGSLTTIQTIVTDAADPLPRADGAAECTHCGACKAACPSGAVGDIDRCLRRHYGGIVPETMRGDVYQLIGCERCQSACPLSSSETSPPYAYPIGELLLGMHTKELKALAGPNFVRQQRMISQAVLYAAVTNAYQHLPLIRTLAETAEEPVKTHAHWAIARLSKGAPNDT